MSSQHHTVPYISLCVCSCWPMADWPQCFTHWCLYCNSCFDFCVLWFLCFFISLTHLYTLSIFNLQHPWPSKVKVHEKIFSLLFKVSVCFIILYIISKKVFVSTFSHWETEHLFLVMKTILEYKPKYNIRLLLENNCLIKRLIVLCITCLNILKVYALTSLKLTYSIFQAC